MPLVSKAFGDIITFTRASTATYFDATGTLQSAAIDAPRLDYNPSTLAAQGFLVEEARTNSIRNNTMQGAVAGTPGTLPTNWVSSSAGGISREVVGSGTANGINYIDIRIFGTTTNTNLALNVYLENALQTAALSGQTWTNSLWAQIVGGSTTGISQIYLAMVEISSGGSDLAYLSGPDFKATIGTFTRRIYTATTTNASTAFIRPGLWVSTTGIGAVIDITLRIGLPQLEQGAFATSVIPTTTTALTRSADVASVNTLSPWYNSAAGTLFAEAQISAGVGATPAAFASLDDTTTSNRIQVRRASPGNLASFRMVSSAGGIDVTLASGTLTGVNKTAVAFTASDQNAVNNGTLFTGITSIASLPTVTRLLLGDGPGSLPLNGYLRRITYYPRRLSNAELVSITS